MITGDLLQAVQAQMEIEDKAQQASFIAMIEAISFAIDRISCEVCMYIINHAVSCK